MTLIGLAAISGVFGFLSIIFVLTSQNFLINEHYSAKTLHMHKVTPNSETASSWDSLGYITPYVEQQSSVRTWVPDTYSVYKGNPEYQRKVSGQTVTNYDILEDPYKYDIYINSERSFSILSSISPTIYLATLILICNMSVANFFCSYYYEIITKKNLTSNLHRNQDNRQLQLAKKIFNALCLIIYGSLLFAIFGAGALLKKAEWGTGDWKVQAEYMVSPQIPSIVYNIIVLALYFIYVKNSSSENQDYWTLTKPDQQFTSNSKALGDYESGPKPLMFAMQPMSSMYIQNQQTQHTPHTPHYIMPNQHLLMTLGAVATNTVKKKINNKGPVSDEFSVIVSIIVFLGGVANLAMSKAFLMETEAQLVIISLVMFAVLEIGRNHVISYCYYLSSKETPDDAQNIFFIAFVDLVVFLVQLFIVVIWQTSMTNLLPLATLPVVFLRGTVLFVTCVFLLLRFIYLVENLSSYAMDILKGTPSDSSEPRPEGGSCDSCFSCCNSCFSCSLRLGTTNKYWFALLETLAYIIIVVCFVLAVFSLTLPVGADNWLAYNPERNVLFLEQMLYQNTAEVEANSACTNGIRNNTLVSDISKICTYTPNFYNTITPISMKIFSWTRFFVLQKQVYGQDSALAPAHVLLCSNGFEQHWGQCKKHFMEPKNFEDKWKNKVLSAAELPL
jgi:hypothetical protein